MCRRCGVGILGNRLNCCKYLSLKIRVRRGEKHGYHTNFDMDPPSDFPAGTRHHPLATSATSCRSSFFLRLLSRECVVDIFSAVCCVVPFHASEVCRLAVEVVGAFDILLPRAAAKWRNKFVHFCFRRGEFFLAYVSSYESRLNESRGCDCS